MKGIYLVLILAFFSCKKDKEVQDCWECTEKTKKVHVPNDRPHTYSDRTFYACDDDKSGVTESPYTDAGGSNWKLYKTTTCVK